MVAMFEKILFPTDFSKYSQKVLECIKELPGVSDVVLLHVMGPNDPISRVWDPLKGIDETKALLAEQSKILDGRGLNVKTRTEPAEGGDISGVIQKVANEEEASVIVMGARGKGVVEGIFLGNVANNVLRYGNTNLLLMRYRILEGRSGPSLEKFCSHPFSKVLCPTDLSKPAENAIAFIKGLPGVENILLQHVVSRGETWKEIEAQTEEINKKLNVIRDELEMAGIKGNIYSSAGNPAEEIIALAEREAVSMIAMSSHGMGLLKQIGVGSTTYDVSRMGDRPVLVVRAGAESLR